MLAKQQQASVSGVLDAVLIDLTSCNITFKFLFRRRKRIAVAQREISVRTAIIPLPRQDVNTMIEILRH